jgi:hypothetical protein
MSIFENFVTDYPQYQASLNKSSLTFFNLAERQDGTACWLIGIAEFRGWLQVVGKTLWCTGIRKFGLGTFGTHISFSIAECFWKGYYIQNLYIPKTAVGLK